ncbi:MAG TPA: glycosyltransferase [Acetobacteraceae bacterium]|nr:glycosyltransferase [Acetobacteraceae bacterium]
MLAPLLLAIAVPVNAFALLGRTHPAARAICAAVSLALTWRYLEWRWTDSLPEGQAMWQQGWAWVFLAFETLALASSATLHVFMSRRIDRSAEADAGAMSPLLSAPTDVFIATYNEERDILERTIVGALNLDHPDLRVWVLDDGARPWVRELAEELGAHYTFRVKGKHAKAGNVNAGLERALSTGRRPEFILLLDADFVPARRMLRRVLPLFTPADVGIVQTPQHFFNPDPMQVNLLCTGAWPDEQRFFFNEILACKDAWGAAFCCGTSAVFRVDALVAAGGMATETVTEDMLTSFKLEEVGYRTIFLNEQLSLGLAPEGLKEYVSQRARWCLGALQQVYTRWGFAGAGRLSLVSRFNNLDTTLYWLSGFIFKLMVISAPMIYWWTGTAVISCTLQDMLFWLAPQVAAGVVFTSVLTGNRVLPVMTDISQLVCSFAIGRTVLTALVKPFGHPFKVTAKGLSSEGVTVHWNFLLPFALIALGTAAGILWNMRPASPLFGTDGFSINLFWSVFNIAVLCVACAVCVEPPKRRRDERFATGEAAWIEEADGARLPCIVTDISVGGARLRRPDGWPAEPTGTLVLDGGALRAPFSGIRVTGDNFALRFPDEAGLRRALIRKLFAGGYSNEVPRVSIPRTLAGVARKVFA